MTPEERDRLNVAYHVAWYAVFVGLLACVVAVVALCLP